MTPELLTVVGINPALSLLPPIMESREARAMLLAIALQESALSHRKQNQNGPARSYFQFELAGIHGVLSHQSSADYAQSVCVSLDIAPSVGSVSDAITYNDVLACAFARLLIWTLPDRLPKMSESDAAWRQYLKAWRPGKPRPETWGTCYAEAWGHV